jgi:hypothetical protein
MQALVEKGVVSMPMSKTLTKPIKATYLDPFIGKKVKMKRVCCWIFQSGGLNGDLEITYLE